MFDLPPTKKIEPAQHHSAFPTFPLLMLSSQASRSLWISIHLKPVVIFSSFSFLLSSSSSASSSSQLTNTMVLPKKSAGEVFTKRDSGIKCKVSGACSYAPILFLITVLSAGNLLLGAMVITRMASIAHIESEHLRHGQRFMMEDGLVGATAEQIIADIERKKLPVEKAKEEAKREQKDDDDDDTPVVEKTKKKEPAEKPKVEEKTINEGKATEKKEETKPKVEEKKAEKVEEKPQAQIQDEVPDKPVRGNIEPFKVVTKKIKDFKALFEWPVLHVVQSRFQIGQGKLHHLSKARLELFKHFTYPSIRAQTSQRFMWLIHVGHELSSTLFQELVDMMKDYDNIYIIRNDFPSGRYGLRAFEEREFQEFLVNFTMYTGNQTRLEHAMAVAVYSKWRTRKIPIPPIVTTRLDMDDACEATYFEKIQESTKKAFVDSENPPKYLFWCLLNTMEWNFLFNQAKGTGGYVKTMAYNKCPSTALTVTGKPPQGMGLGEHSLLMEKLEKASNGQDVGKGFYGCGYANSSDCLMLYDLKGFRSRAPTSNSYFLAKDFQSEQSSLMEKYKAPYQEKMAEEVQQRFNIITSVDSGHGGSLNYINKYYNDHICDIATDFTVGYCATRGFTCTDKAKEEYQKLHERLSCKPAEFG